MSTYDDPAPPKWHTIKIDGRPIAQVRNSAWVEWNSRRDSRTLPPEIRAAVIGRDGYVCGLCGGVVDPEDVHIDHVMPRSLGGTNDLANLQVSHSLCNMSKGNRI